MNMGVIIGICDDEKLYIQKLKSIMRALFQEKENLYEIYTFLSGRELLEYCEKKEMLFDVLFLDIDMPEINGIQVAQKIREKNKQTIIIFLTNHGEYVKVGYQVQAFRYVAKNDEQELEEALNSMQKVLKNKEQIELQDIEGERYVYSRKEILYAETLMRRVQIHTENKNFLMNTTLVELHNRLGEDFYRSHRAFLINLAHVSSFGNGSIVMDNGKKVILSREKAKEFEKKYLAWRFERGNG